MDPKDYGPPIRGPRKRAGRKPLPPEQKLVPLTIMVLPAERDRCAELGGSPWARRKLFGVRTLTRPPP